MGIQDWSENIILVELPRESEMGSEINTVTEILRDRDNCDVVVDFSNVDIVTSSSLSKLLNLNKLLIDCGHRLILCNVDKSTKRIFQVTGLDQMSKFAEDRHMAVTSLEKESKQEVPAESQETALEASHEVPLERLWERKAKTNGTVETQKKYS